jgi:hypothetical protein
VIRHRIAVIVALVALVALPSAASAAFDPGQFRVTVTRPAGGPGADGGAMPDCDPPFVSVGALIMGGADHVDVTCAMNSSSTGDVTTGSVANATLAADDPGFADGTITMTCDQVQTMTMKVRVSGGIGSMAPSLRSMNGTMYRSCVFRMAFPDAEHSTLDGTVEMNAKMDSGDGDEGDDSIEIQMDAKVFITDGAGAFEGQVGEGSFSDTRSVPLGLSGGGGAGGGGEGGGGAGGGGGSVTDAEQAVCDAAGPGVGTCSADVVTALCGNPMFRGAHGDLCAAAGRRLVIRLGRALPRATTRVAGNPMTMKLSAKAGNARILLPVPKKGLAKVTEGTTKLRIVATAGATCTLRASDGALVGTAKARSGSKAVTVAVRRNSLDGAKTVQATCTLKGKRFTSQRVKIS